MPPDAAAWDGRVVSAFLLLLPRLTDLRELIAWPSLMLPQALVGLSRQAQRTLTRLVFAVSGDRTLGPRPRLHLLNTFTSLHYLKLRMCTGSEHVLETATIQGLDIPSLVHLHWLLDPKPKDPLAPTDERVNERALAFLARSRFAALRVLTLELESFKMKRRSVLPLHPFFVAHADIKTAIIYASNDVLEELFLCGFRATELVFDYVPNLFVVHRSERRLRSLTFTLDIGADSHSGGEDPRLRELFKFLLETEETSVQQIRLKARTRHPRWQWSRLPELVLNHTNLSSQVGLLLAASAQLEKRGIQLLDEDEKRAVTMWD
jgi:hypothetical protein